MTNPMARRSKRTSRPHIARAADAMQKISSTQAQLNVRVSPELRRKLKEIAFRDDTTIVDVVTAALEAYVKKHGSS